MDPTPEHVEPLVLAQQAAVFALLKRGVPTVGAATAWRILTETAASTLGVARASIWLLSEDGESLVAADSYELAAGTHASGALLHAANFPAYVHALRWSRAIVAPLASADPRTRDYAAAFPGASGVVSVLDAGIWEGGEAKGAVCLETVGARRDWTADEQQFAASLADIAANVLVNESLRRARTQLQESQELFASAIRSSPDAIAIVRLTDSRILLVNEGFQRFSGYSEAESVGRTAIELGLWVNPAQRDEWIARLQAEGSVRDFEVEFRIRDGRIRSFVLSGELIEVRASPCAVLVCRDITDLRRLESLVAGIAQGVAPATGESFFRSLVGHLARVLEADLVFAGEIDSVDSTRVHTVAVNADQAPAADFSYLLAGSPCESILDKGLCAFAHGVAEQFPGDAALAARGIQAYVGAPLVDSRGRPMGLLSALYRRPIDDTRLAENLLRIFATRASAELERQHDVSKLAHLAHYDPLTGLPNRILFEQQVATGLAPREDGTCIGGALLLADLDRFKEINGTLGHPVGDIVLVQLARLLEDGMRAEYGAAVARLGGDEFAVWIPGLVDAVVAESAASRVLALLEAPVVVKGYRLKVGASLGIAYAPAHGTTPSALLRCADVAMYAAKRGGVGIATYDVAEDPNSSERLGILAALGDAMRNGEMRVHYQPRVGAADGRVRGFETLVRWERPGEGLLSPGIFVPLAELSGAIRPLTVFVLEEALRQQREWRDSGWDVKVSVNLSARQLIDEGCVDLVGNCLLDSGTDPGALELEITESAFIADPQRAAAMLGRIRDTGVCISIDDFGTGFSSLSHLQHMPLDALKIDQSFIRHMVASETDRAIVRSTIHLAHDLGLAVVAEGVEDAATLAMLRDMGCDEVQGQFIAPPMGAGEAGSWLASHGS